jgi:hypothetical protein
MRALCKQHVLEIIAATELSPLFYICAVQHVSVF